MKGYILGVVSLSLVSAIIISIAPAGHSQRYLRLLAGLALTLCIAAPLLSLIGEGEFSAEYVKELLGSEEESAANYDEIYNKTIINAGKQNVEKTLKSEMLQELKGNDEDIDLYLVLSNESDEIYIERVEIIIYPSGLSLDPHFMEDYISERLDCSCVVIYKSEK